MGVQIFPCTAQRGDLVVQARQMGAHAAHTMAGVAEETGSGFTFELFAHVTRFVGKKVVLLGQYNGQRLEHEPESDMVSYSRITEVRSFCPLSNTFLSSPKAQVIYNKVSLSATQWCTGLWQQRQAFLTATCLDGMGLFICIKVKSSAC